MMIDVSEYRAVAILCCDLLGSCAILVWRAAPFCRGFPIPGSQIAPYPDIHVTSDMYVRCGDRERERRTETENV